MRSADVGTIGSSAAAPLLELMDPATVEISTMMARWNFRLNVATKGREGKFCIVIG